MGSLETNLPTLGTTKPNICTAVSPLTSLASPYIANCDSTFQPPTKFLKSKDEFEFELAFRVWKYRTRKQRAIEYMDVEGEAINLDLGLSRVRTFVSSCEFTRFSSINPCRKMWRY
jgi:hypothetical protein